MKGLGFLMLAWVVSCGGEKRDDLTPYVAKLQELGHYTDTLHQYSIYLRTEGMTDKANDVEQVMQNFRDDLDKLDIEDKHVRALNNELKRTLKNAMRKLVEPDFPTFVPNAQKAIAMVEEEMVVIYANLEKLWAAEGKTEPFPIKWKKDE